jgi:hypothetical protein
MNSNTTELFKQLGERDTAGRVRFVCVLCGYRTKATTRRRVRCACGPIGWGVRLKLLLGRLGIRATPTCGCAARAAWLNSLHLRAILAGRRVRRVLRRAVVDVWFDN